MMIAPSVWFGAILATAVAVHRQRAAASASRNGATIERPAHVQEALHSQNVMYYFCLGSKILLSELENRGVNGSKIEILHMEPAVEHSLSFNLRGFVPLEPRTRHGESGVCRFR